MKNKIEVEKYLEENKDKTFNLNLMLKYSGNSKIPLVIERKNNKRKVLFIGQSIEGIESISYEILSKMSRAEILRKIRRKIIVTTSSNVLLVGKNILTPIGKARKIKSIRILKELPTKTNIEQLVKESKITVSKKSVTVSLGKNTTTTNITKLKEELEEQIRSVLKKVTAKYYLYSTFQKSCPILF